MRLAWPAHDTLYRADSDGSIEVSRNGGGFKIVGQGARRAVQVQVVGPEHLYLALSDGSTWRRRTAASSWKDTFRP